MYNFIRVSSLLQNPEKSHDRSWQISGGKDGQTLYHRVLPATAKWLTSTAAVDWHLKVKDKKRDVGLTKNYNITVSLQKISSIHKFIQQILGSHKLNDQTHFWPDPPQNYWNNLTFLNLHQHAKNQFISSIHSWNTANFRVLWLDWPHPFLTMVTQIYFD